MVVMPNLNFIFWLPELKRVTFLGKVALATAAAAQTAVAEPENVKKIVQVFLHQFYYHVLVAARKPLQKFSNSEVGFRFKKFFLGRVRFSAIQAHFVHEHFLAGFRLAFLLLFY